MPACASNSTSTHWGPVPFLTARYSQASAWSLPSVLVASEEAEASETPPVCGASTACPTGSTPNHENSYGRPWPA